jgi:hypothetical protein
LLLQRHRALYQHRRCTWFSLPRLLVPFGVIGSEPGSQQRLSYYRCWLSVTHGQCAQAVMQGAGLD